MGNGPRSVPVKLLARLDAYSHENVAYSLSELARQAGLPLATAHRLIGELARWGALERGEDGRYRIGLRLVELAALCPRGHGLRDVALPFMEDLYEATHQNVQLAVRDGLDGVYIERIAGRSAVPVLTQVGAHWPLHATGVGLVLLAHAPADVQEAVLAAPLATFTRFTISDPAELRRALAEIRRTGFALSDRQITDDAFSVAAPVMAAGPGGGCVASLSVVVPVSDPHRASWAPAVRAAANGISRQLSSRRARERRMVRGRVRWRRTRWRRTRWRRTRWRGGVLGLLADLRRPARPPVSMLIDSAWYAAPSRCRISSSVFRQATSCSTTVRLLSARNLDTPSSSSAKSCATSQKSCVECPDSGVSA